VSPDPENIYPVVPWWASKWALHYPDGKKGDDWSRWIIESYHNGQWTLAAHLLPEVTMDVMLKILKEYKTKRLGPYQDETYRLRNRDTNDVIMADIL